MRVPRSQRGGEIVEPLVRDQWFVRMQPLAQPALQVTITCLLILTVAITCLLTHTYFTITTMASGMT